MTNQTTTFRKRIDFLIKCATALFTSIETSNALDSLRMAKAWLGEAMKSMALPSGSWADGQPLYNASDSPGKIPPTSDTTDEQVPEWLGNIGGHLDGINWMRQQISDTHLVFPQEEEQKRCYQKAADYLAEARMWYGFELQNLRASNARELTPEQFYEKVASNPEIFQRPATPEEVFTAQEGDWYEPLEELQDPFPEEITAPEFTDEELEAIVPINSKPKKKKK